MGIITRHTPPLLKDLAISTAQAPVAEAAANAAAAGVDHPAGSAYAALKPP